LVEFIEFHKILGVSKFYFYNLSISEDVDRVLRYYMRKGEATVLDWKIGSKYKLMVSITVSTAKLSK
jgi:hypothetical protein